MEEDRRAGSTDDGDVEELDLDTWHEMDLEVESRTGKGWSGSEDQEEKDDAYLEEEEEDDDDDWDYDDDDDDWDDDFDDEGYRDRE